MKSFKLVYRSLFLSLVLSLPACSSSNSETVEDAMDDSSDNQVASTEKEPEMVDGEIPSPEIVSNETAAASAMAPAEVSSMPTGAGDQQEIDAILQAEETSQHELAQKPKAEPAAVAVAPSEQPESYGMQAPSLASVAAEANGKKPVRHKEIKARSSQKVAKSNHKSSRPQLEGAAPSDGPGQKSYIVQPGDTLGRISRLLYGTSKRWTELAQVNNLDKSSAIYPGDVLQYAADENTASFEAKWEALPHQSHIVVQNDTLYSIAERVMGNKHYWKLIWRWNAESVADPHHISPGQSIRFVSPQDLTAFYTERKKQSLAH